MAIIESTSGDALAVEPGSKAARTVVVPRGDGYSVAGATGVIPAALGAGSYFFSLRSSPTTSKLVFIDRVRLHYTTIAAYTTPVTAGRRLALYRGSSATPSGGAALNAVAKRTSQSPSVCHSSNGGDARIATTAALTVAGAVWENDPIAVMTLTAVGAAGGSLESVFEFGVSESSELILEPGQILGVRNPVAMDPAGTWQLGVNVQWREADGY